MVRAGEGEGALVLDMMEPQLAAIGHVSLALPHLSVQDLPVLSGLPAWAFGSYSSLPSSLPLFCRDSHAHLLVENAYGEIGQQGDGVGFPVAGSDAAARVRQQVLLTVLQAYEIGIEDAVHDLHPAPKGSSSARVEVTGAV